MFDIWHSFSQLCLGIYGEKMYFFFNLSTLKWFVNAKKSVKNRSKSFPLFLSCKIKLDLFYEGIKFSKIVFWHFFRTGIILTPLIGILKIRRISMIILIFSDTHFFPPKNTPKNMIWMFGLAISLICTIETSFKHQSYRYWSEVMKIHLNFDTT